MSKQREQPVVDKPSIPIPPPVSQITKPAKVEIGSCLGLMVECPACGKPASVTDARGARTATQVVSSRWWVMLKCTGYCGNVLRKTAELVTVLPESLPQPVFKPLGAAVGHFVYCPQCAAKSQATWDMDHGHRVICPGCGDLDLAGATPVEVIG